MSNVNVTHTEIVIAGISVRFDTLDNGNSGFGYQINGRSYQQGGFGSLLAAKRAAPGHVKRTLQDRERAVEANANRMREMRTIRS